MNFRNEGHHFAREAGNVNECLEHGVYVTIVPNVDQPNFPCYL